MIDTEKLKKQIGDKLKAAREEKGMSQEELAKMLGLSKVGYGALERGKNLIGLQYLIMLTFLLEKPITYFFPDYVVSSAEHNDLMLDPQFRDIADFYAQMSPESRSILRHIAWRFGPGRGVHLEESEE